MDYVGENLVSPLRVVCTPLGREKLDTTTRGCE